MTLQDMQVKVILELKAMTVDDFSADPGLIARKVLGTSEDAEIKSFLASKFEEVSFERIIYKTEGEERSFKSELADVKKSIDRIQETKLALNAKIEAIKNEIANLELKLQESERQNKSLLSEIDKIEGTALELILGDQKDKINKIRENKTLEIDRTTRNLRELHIALDENVSKLKVTETELSEKQKVEREFNNSIKGIAIKRKKLEAKRDFLEAELSSLSFLCKVLDKQKLNGNVGFYRTDPLDEEEFKEIICAHTMPGVIVPENWWEILHAIFSLPIPDASGSVLIRKIVDQNRHEKREIDLLLQIERGAIDLKNLDFAILLALKDAVVNRLFILTRKGEIKLALSGGVFATIQFREKGEIIKGFQESDFEMFLEYEKYCNTDHYSASRGDTNVFVNYEVLYSGINIMVPIGYYFITESYVIEIRFSVSPVLLDGNRTLVLAEESLRKRLEEEKKRLDDDDDD